MPAGLVYFAAMTLADGGGFLPQRHGQSTTTELVISSMAADMQP